MNDTKSMWSVHTVYHMVSILINITQYHGIVSKEVRMEKKCCGDSCGNSVAVVAVAAKGKHIDMIYIVGHTSWSCSPVLTTNMLCTRFFFFWGVYMSLWVIVILCEYIVVLDVEFSGTYIIARARIYSCIRNIDRYDACLWPIYLHIIIYICMFIWASCIHIIFNNMKVQVYM